MADEPDKSPFLRAVLVTVAGLLLYLIAFFPVMSYAARHAKSNPLPWAGPWRPLPSPVFRGLLHNWMRIDPVGRANFLNAYADSRVHLPTDPFP